MDLDSQQHGCITPTRKIYATHSNMHLLLFMHLQKSLAIVKNTALHAVQPEDVECGWDGCNRLRTVSMITRDETGSDFGKLNFSMISEVLNFSMISEVSRQFEYHLSEL